jgi:hypothetical protein
MKRLIYLAMLLSIALAACAPATPAPTATFTPSPTDIPTATYTPTPEPTATATPTPTRAYPLEGYGPANFPAEVNPLTGLKVADPALLDRRPMLVKVANLPRNVRPQWGLSFADLVFEYYTEEGTTRFAALYYGQDAETVGPIRSGRFIDGNLVRGYKAVFAFGFAYIAEMNRFWNSDFANRMVLEEPGSPMKRFDPNGYSFLTVGTADLSAYATSKNMTNVRQDLNGMFFKLEPPAAGEPAPSFRIRYSASIYNRWDYDTATGKYLRFVDTTEVFNAGDVEKYEQLTDRITGKPLAFENVLVLKVNHELFSPGIYDILLSGTGDGFAFRDGQMYPVKWLRNATDVISLTNPDGTPFALKPGATWFEIVGLNTNFHQDATGLRFVHLMP